MRLTAVEHGSVRSQEGSLGRSEWDRLVRSAVGLPADLVRRTASGAKVGGYVGVLDLGWCQLEILPKTVDDPSDDARRKFLVDLLFRSGLVPRPFISRAEVATRRDSLLETLVAAFAEQLHTELVRGVPRRYEVRNERLPQVKGRIRFEALARSLPTERHRMPVRYAPLQHDNELTRCLRALVDVLSRQSVSPRVAETLDHCDRMLGAAKRVALARVQPDRTSLSRKEMRWQPFLELLSMLKSGLAPIPVGSGSASAFGLVFSLHDVFEKLIRRSLSRERPAGLKLLDRPVRPRLLHPVPAGPPVLTLRPDLTFADDSREVRLVADAKWKRLSLSSRSLGLSPGDIYQVATYMAAHSVDRGILLFPELGWMRGDGPWQKTYALAGGTGQLMIGGVDTEGLASRDPERRRSAIDRLSSLVTLAQR